MCPVGRIAAARSIRSRFLVAVILVIAIVGFYGVDVAVGSRLFFTHDIDGSDIWHLHYPIKQFYAEELHHGRLPLWCPDIGMGFPLHAEGEVAALYPANLLLYALLPLPLAFNWSILLTALLAGAFTALYARQMGASEAGSLLAALVFALSGFLVTHLKQLNLTAAAIWVPLLLWLLEREAARQARRNRIGLALATACMVLAGHPQIAYYNGLVAAGYACLMAWRCRRRAETTGAKPTPLSYLRGVAAAMCVGLLLAAPQIVPTLELHRVGPRQGGLPLEAATFWDYRPEHLAAFVRPMAFGDPGRLIAEPIIDPQTGAVAHDPHTGLPIRQLIGYRQDPEHPMLFWEMTAYVGIVPLMLALGAVGFQFATPSVRTLTALVVFGLLMALGRHGGLYYPFFYLVPGFDLFRFQSRFLLYVDLGLAVLSGIGLTSISMRVAQRSGRRGARVVVALVIAVTIADLVTALGDHNPKIDASRWTEPPATAKRIFQEGRGRMPLARIAGSTPQNFVFRNAYYRARGWAGDLSPYDPARLTLDPNWSLLHGLCNLNFFFPIYPRWSMTASELAYAPSRSPRQAVGDVRLHMMSLLNVGYVLDVTGAPIDGLTLVDEYPGDRWYLGALLIETAPYTVRLYRNPSVLPRAFVVRTARPFRVSSESEDQAMTRAMIGGGFDPRSEVAVAVGPDDPAVTPGSAGPPLDQRVDVDEYSPQRVRLSVSAHVSCWLFLSDTYYPGWNATVDGVATAVYRANIAGRAVRLGPGTHDIVFAFSPASFRLGVCIALVGAVLLVILSAGRTDQPST
jgi:Bacterial membrane protein YfhO